MSIEVRITLLLGSHAGSFWPQDSTCLSWLDQQPMGSVIYVAFGSTATLSQQQFDEIALGLELIGQPFCGLADLA